MGLLCRLGGRGDIAPVRASEEPPADDKQRAEREEREVPGGLVGAFANMVDREDVMIDHALNEIENAPPDDHPANEGTSADGRATVGCASPEDVDAYGDGDPCGSVEEAVPKHVGLQTRYGRFGVAAFAGEHCDATGGFDGGRCRPRTRRG